MPTSLRKILVAALALVSCAAFALAIYGLRFQSTHGPADPERFDTPIAAAAPVSYREQVAPILEKRCVVCHACYDAPCQLKLGSFDGIARGITPELVYHGSRLTEAAPTRLFIDAQKTSDWRKRGFSPVLNEFQNTPAQNRAASLLYRVLQLKQTHPLADGALAPKDLDFSIDRKQSCPKIEAFDLYEAANPLAGMPYGLPAIDASDQATIGKWLEAGAPDDGTPPLSADVEGRIAEWERFLNGASPKERLMSRYLYEHLFLAHLYLGEIGHSPAFKLVRSSTPPGEALAIISSRRPFDDPGVTRVYYRLKRELEPIVGKTHMPYRFDGARMERYRALFLASTYDADAEPSYDPKTASNGLATFKAIPEASRYRFMLDDAQYFVMTFIKGPVCRGQVAVNVIEDRFWVYFFAPEAGVQRDAEDTARRALQDLTLPAADGSNSPSLFSAWKDYAARERKFQAERIKGLRAFARNRGDARLDMIWDGDASNANAALTIMRHFDSATVVKGLVGAPPKTAWVLDYSLFERIYYLLSAGYDVYGNVTHNLNSRLYMDFLRMEGEANFIGFLPQRARAPTLARWYRDATKESLEHMTALAIAPAIPSAVRYRGADAKSELYALLQQRLAKVLDRRLALDNVADGEVRAAIEKLASLRGALLTFLPEMSILAIEDDKGGAQYFTLIKDTGHKNVTHLLMEKDELAPEDNGLTLVPGVIGAYPNAFFRLARSDLAAFANAIASLRSEDDYRGLADRFAIRRTSPQFWAFSDAVQSAEALMDQDDRGLLDYNRFENR